MKGNHLPATRKSSKNPDGHANEKKNFYRSQRGIRGGGKKTREEQGNKLQWHILLRKCPSGKEA